MTPYLAPPQRSVLGRQVDRLAEFVGQVGQVADMTVGAARALFRRPVEWREFINQLEVLGVASVGIVAVTSLFIGMVMSVQFAFGLR
ncbi:MAG TPA: ABC transporter permease, partial [Polyangiaceae bacterium]